MNDVVDTVVKALEPIAAKIGEGAAHLYEIYARQMFAEGLSGLIITAILWTLTIVGIVMVVKLGKKSKWDAYGAPDDINAMLFIGASVFIVIPVLFSVVQIGSLTENITKIINPEYHAINRLIDQVTGEGEEVDG